MTASTDTDWRWANPNCSAMALLTLTCSVFPENEPAPATKGKVEEELNDICGGGAASGCRNGAADLW